ncbi:MAG: autotransporter outer membrane beta-barrel domain-containing protein [Steroidobacter sp.]
MTLPVAKPTPARFPLMLSAALVPLAVLVTSTAHADLTDLINAGQLAGYNEIRFQSAVATQAVYDQLKTAGCDDAQTGPTAKCGNGAYLVWRNVREVVHNANYWSNQLNANGVQKPTTFTLGRTVAQLGGALQWCNGEEFASLNSLSTSFISAQTSSLAARVTALRFGASGFHAANVSLNDDESLAYDIAPRGGGASADDDSDDDYDSAHSPWSVWGIFGNGSYIKGEKAPTGSEEGFDYKGPSFNIGVDHRVSQHWVLGAMTGYQKQSLDFTPFLNNLAVGGSDMSGFSVQPYALYESDHWYLNLSLGYQNIKFDTNRIVNYGTQAGTILPVTITVAHNTTDDSAAHAGSLSSYDTLGFSIRPVAAWSIEPSLSLDYQHLHIGQFTENDLNNQGFAFTVDGQTINSIEGIPELRMQYTFTPHFGVWTPYVDVQWHHQFNTSPRTVNAIYADAQNLLTPAASFTIKTDELDPWYQVYAAGIAAVIRGSSAGETHSSGGLQLYANYRRYEGLRNYKQQIYAAGLRYEF